MFRFKGPIIRGSSTGEQFLRLVGLMAVILITAVLFWKHSERTVEILETRSAIRDDLQILTAEQKAKLRKMGKAFQSEYGFEFKVHITDGVFTSPEKDSKTIFFGIRPNTETVVIELPRLLEKALEPGTSARLKTEYFQEYLQTGNVAEPLFFALSDIWDQLGGIEGRNEYRQKIQ